MRLIWTASSYDVACILFIPNNSDDFQSQCGRNEIGQVECHQSILNSLPCTSVLDLCTIMQSWWSQRIIMYTPYNHGGVRDFGIGSRKAY